MPKMSAEDYIRHHWLRRSVWEHLTRRKHVRRLRACAQRMEGSTFADVGCAFGHSTDMMARWAPGDWTGIDFSRTAVEHAVKEFGQRRRFLFCESLAALASLGPFDGVICSEVIEHVDDPQTLVESLKAITCRVLVMTTPAGAVGDPGHVSVYTLESFSAEIAGAEVVQSGPFLYATWRPKT